MKLWNHYLRRCKRCNNVIDDDYDVKKCPHCGFNIWQNGIKVDFILRCRECNNIMNSKLEPCQKCGWRFE